MRRKTALAGVLLAAAIAAIGAGTASAATPPCGTLPLSSTHYRHVIWILEENHSYGKIIGNSSARYINALARGCGLATNYHNISHPSLPTTSA